MILSFNILALWTLIVQSNAQESYQNGEITDEAGSRLPFPTCSPTGWFDSKIKMYF